MPNNDTLPARQAEILYFTEYRKTSTCSTLADAYIPAHHHSHLKGRAPYLGPYENFP
ncbi:hypothetical protein RvY_06995 [Ramazzottius varieornatus]|uniref:Uncharacterized protein n=1 Tax=Ramazzottius varieornatus TaxID=947166 RepID=A0A1D1V3T0_RAMVA|nr:hypothetical protein RvY_06995 [Ramazzottius varieornatus]